jgi:hypothetical protein
MRRVAMSCDVGNLMTPAARVSGSGMEGTQTELSKNSGSQRACFSSRAKEGAQTVARVETASQEWWHSPLHADKLFRMESIVSPRS